MDYLHINITNQYLLFKEPILFKMAFNYIVYDSDSDSVTVYYDFGSPNVKVCNDESVQNEWRDVCKDAKKSLNALPKTDNLCESGGCSF